MKREEILKNSISQEEVNIKAIVAKDAKFLKRQKRKLEDDIEDAQESIDSYLANPDMNIDTELLARISNKRNLECDLKLIEIAEQYV